MGLVQFANLSTKKLDLLYSST